MAHVVRPYRDDDAEALAGILAAAITRIGPAAYSAEQVAARPANAICNIFSTICATTAGPFHTAMDSQ